MKIKYLIIFTTLTMNVSIKIQHLATVKDIEVSLFEKLNNLKEIIQKLFAIPISQQSLMLDGRNISTAAKPLGELGPKEGAVETFLP